MWIDTHCHLYDSSLVERQQEVQQRALDAGINEILLPNIDVHSVPKMKEAVDQFPELTVRQMIGLHPCYVKEDYKSQLDTLKAAYESDPDRFCAVGEIGLDLYWDKTTLDIQIDALNTQLDWSVEWNLPIALHVRSSFKELFPVLEAAQERHGGKLRGVFHCFSGGKKQINRALRLGEFYFGLGGVITYNRSATDPVVRAIPQDRILLETDAPYLTPTSFKGQKNEPAFMAEVAQTVAEILDIDEAELAPKLAANTRNLFG